MSLLVSGDINTIELNNTTYEINTDFRLWIDFICATSGKDRERVGETLLAIFPYYIEDYELLMQKLLEYMQVSDGKEVSEESQLLAEVNEKPTFDLLQDEFLVIADFQREYNINLLDPALEMSWRRFKILLSNLSDKSSVTARAQIRDMDVKDLPKKNQSRILKLKERYSLETATTRQKMTLQERNDRFKKYVNKRHDKLKQEL